MSHIERRPSLTDFADAVAARLPGGPWRAEHHTYAQYRDQFEHTGQVWDHGLTDGVVADCVIPRAAILHGPVWQRLYIIDRPRHQDQFLVAALEPEGFKPHQMDRIKTPDGIAVPADPVRAAAALSRRFLHRYHLALAALQLYALKQPEPPHRPHAAEPDKRLMLVFYPDGAVGAPESTVPREVHDLLYIQGFQNSPHQAAFLLPAAYSDAQRAELLLTVVQHLTAQGIGVDFRRAEAGPAPTAPRPSPALVPPRASQPAPSRSR
ncbi:hypothetical protein RM572_26535 [Streptomyces sp. DSM 42041]|uniref:Uncharacterized protein n=1 Tax=Streptomyces hazeniae TaxID=3075538 RepID=A0ABU2NZA8_9ACTN|nr:hypothetical protein [Streptomyces sp. DSM 42041]MDT0382321.1 hypothetical protein [Streptomyces sp. DSM 42041]